MKLHFSPSRCVAFLYIICIAMMLLHFLAMQLHFNDYFDSILPFDTEYWQVSFFDMDEESSFATWYSSASLVFAAGLLYLRSLYQSSFLKVKAVWWRILAVAVLFLSIEEIGGIHEWLNTFDSLSWTSVAFVVLPLLCVALIPFFHSLTARQFGILLIPVVIYLGGAVGVEYFTDDKVNSLHYNMWTILEEGMEMLGVVVFIDLFLRHFLFDFKKCELVFEQRKKK